MGYSNDPSMVRVDFFREGGKWYTTEAVKWTGSYFACPPSGTSEIKCECIHDAFIHSLRDHFADHPNRLCEMSAVCLKPYHEHSHPLMLKNGGWIDKGRR
jgi:hypothetical protein